MIAVRRVPRAAATTVVAVLLAACGESDGDAPIDVADIEAGYGGIVRSTGTVLGVSGHGQVVREGGAGAWCVVDLDGAEGDCWPVDQQIEPGTVQWSPDGSMVAFDGRIDRMSGSDSDVRVLDVGSGEIVTIADDGGDDPGGPQDLLPVWVDEGRLAFLRDRDGQLQLVHADVGGDIDSVDIDSLEFPEIVSRNAAVVEGDYTVATGRDLTELVRIDQAGEVRAIVEVTGRGAEIGGTSRDDRAVVTSGVEGGGLTPVVYVAGDATVSAPFTAASAAVSPDGRLVAATATDRAGVMLWDPAGGGSRRLDPRQAPVIEGRVRLVWATGDRLVLWSPASWQVVTLSL